MMKKLLFAAIVAAFGITACQKTEIPDAAQSGMQTFTISTSLPAQLETRAAGDGLTVNRCIMEVYLDGALFGERLIEEVSGLAANFSVRLVAGKTYDFVFWADKSGATVDDDLHYNTSSLKAVKLNGAYTGNNEEFDAFFAAKQVKVDATKTITVELQRPFGQLNVKTLDMSRVASALPALVPEKVSVEFKEIPTGINLMTGELLAEKAAVKYDVPAELANNEANAGELTVDYIFAPKGEAQQIVDFTMSFLAADGATEVAQAYEFTNIPVQRNYRTNVSGNLLTKKATINVEIKPGFDGDDIEVDVTQKKMTWAKFCELYKIDTTIDGAGDLYIDGQNEIIITDWADVWYGGNLTVKNMTFLHGITFTAKTDNLDGTVLVENNTFGPCDWNAVKEMCPEGSNQTTDGKRIDNAGGGLCLDIETKKSPNLAVIVRNNVFEGENDITLPRSHPRTNTESNNLKARGHAVAINAISGGGNTMAESVLIEGNTVTGVRGNAVQLYAFAYPITVRNNTINSWGRNSETAQKTNADFAVRGDIKSGGSLSLENNYFGMDEEGFATGVNHVKVNDYAANTDGTRKAGTYTEAVVVNGALVKQDDNGAVVCLVPALPEGVKAADLENKGGVAVDASGNTVLFDTGWESLNNAMATASDIYFAPNTTIAYKAHGANIPATGINIHGNGARLEGGECDFAIQYTTYAEGSTVDINIENLNNARVWGDPAIDCTFNIKMTNCSFVGNGYGSEKYSLGLLMLRGKSLSTHNITLEECYCEGVQVGIHSANNGTFIVRNSTFKNVGIPINIAKKSTKPASVEVENCKFIGCGLPENGEDVAWDYAAPIRVVDNSGPANSTTVNISGCEITGRLGSYDVLLTDYRTGKVSFPVAYNIADSGDLVVREE